VTNRGARFRRCLYVELSAVTGGCFACRPIHDAVEADSLATVRQLLCAGADITMKKYSGETVLHLAKSAEMKQFIQGLFTAALCWFLRCVTYVQGIYCYCYLAGCWCGYLFGARCRLAYGPADATATQLSHYLLLQ